MKQTGADLLEWLAGDECHDGDDADLIGGLGRRLRAVGCPIDCLALHLRTLDPEIVGRTAAWFPGEPVQILDRRDGLDRSSDFVGSPVRHVMETSKRMSVRTDDPESRKWTLLDVYKGRGLIELLVYPLATTNGLVSAAAFCTGNSRGFSPDEKEVIDRIVPALRNACELRTLRKFDLALLDTYTGKATARRILGGKIRRGQIESLDAALMICDLQGFTAASNNRPAAEILAMLDTYFDCIVPSIVEGGGGEIVKFMGDAVLAFFQSDDAMTSCKAAMDAARKALTKLARETSMSASVALHYGQMSYGNIGSGRRLDFTVIGPDVNLVSRVQGVCASTRDDILVSDRFARLLGSEDMKSAGFHSLKGFDEPVHLFAYRPKRDLFEHRAPQDPP